jgi:hypothetical protein
MTERRRSRHAAMLSRIVVAGASATGMFGLVAAMGAAARPQGPTLVPLVVGEVPAGTSATIDAAPAPAVTVPAPAVAPPTPSESAPSTPGPSAPAPSAPAPVVTGAPPAPATAPEPAPTSAPRHRTGRTTRS